MIPTTKSTATQTPPPDQPTPRTQYEHCLLNLSEVSGGLFALACMFTDPEANPEFEADDYCTLRLFILDLQRKVKESAAELTDFKPTA